eukprot:scaffold15488_cov62-Phaeocystis_antarctica.AAC.1
MSAAAASMTSSLGWRSSRALMLETETADCSMAARIAANSTAASAAISAAPRSSSCSAGAPAVWTSAEYWHSCSASGLLPSPSVSRMCRVRAFMATPRRKPPPASAAKAWALASATGVAGSASSRWTEASGTGRALTMTLPRRRRTPSRRGRPAT